MRGRAGTLAVALVALAGTSASARAQTAGVCLDWAWLDCIGPTTHDRDRDGLDDRCEAALAYAFRPALVFHPDEAHAARHPYWSARASEDGREVRIFYALSYEQDPGDPDFGGIFSHHDGDPEFIVLRVGYDASGRWLLNGGYLSNHYGAPAQQDGAFEHTDPDLLWLSAPRGRPVVFVAIGKHANFLSMEACDAGGFVGADRCGWSEPVDLFPEGFEGRDLGLAGIPATQFINQVMRNDRYEWYWLDVRFCGWQFGGRGYRTSCAPAQNSYSRQQADFEMSTPNVTCAADTCPPEQWCVPFSGACRPCSDGCGGDYLPWCQGQCLAEPPVGSTIEQGAGGMISDAISRPGEQDTFTFDAVAGQSVQLRVADASAGPLAPLIWLYRPDGSLVTRGGGAAVGAVVCQPGTCPLDATGTFTIVIEDGTSGGMQIGSYNLYMARAPGANERGKLVSGGMLSDRIGLGDLDSYTFFARAGDSIQLRVGEPDPGPLAPRVTVHRPDGSLFGTGAGTNVARLACAPSGACRADESGIYTVVVADGTSGKAQIGDYQIHFVRAPCADEHGALFNGGVRSGRIDVGDLDSFTFHAEQGDTIRIRVGDVSVGALAPRVTLYRPDGSRMGVGAGSAVASVACSPGGPCRAETTGTYTVVIADGTSGGAQAGAYEIHFAAVPGANEGGLLEPGDVVSAEITLGDLDSYTFYATVGDMRVLRVIQTGDGSFTPRASLYRPDGSLMAAANGKPVATFSCPSRGCSFDMTGLYTVVVGDGTSGRAQAGPYSVWLE